MLFRSVSQSRYVRLDEVELVVEALTAAKRVAVALVNEEEVAKTLVPMKLVEKISLKRLA